MAPAQDDPKAARKAAALVVAAMLIIGLIDNFVPAIAVEAGLWQFHAVRAAIALPLLALVCLAMGWRLRPRRWQAVAARSLFTGAAMLVYFGCLAILPIGIVAAGLFTSPIFVLLISVFWLGEGVGPRRILAVALGFLGVLVIVRPGGDMNALAAVPVLGGVLYAIGAIGTRTWCRDESAASLVAGFFVCVGAFGLVGALVLALFGPPEALGFATRPWVAAPAPAFWIWTAVQAVMSLLAVAMIIRAYQTAPASRVAVFEYALVPFASLWALFLWGETLSAGVLAGMVLIVAAGVVLASSRSQALRA